MTPSGPGPAMLRENSPVWIIAVVAAALVGLILLRDSIRSSSATYDEVAYLAVAARWWRTGEQFQITRMGSPLTFWKLQQAPVFWVLDRTDRGGLIDDPIRRQAELLPLARLGGLWIWVAALVLCAGWSRRLYGPRTMALAAWLFVLSPNLLAHGALVTMEMPLVACSTGMLFLFWLFLETGRVRWFWASACVAGLSFSCKYTTVLYPPILALLWWVDRLRREVPKRFLQTARRVAQGMTAYVLVLLLVNFAVPGFAMLPLSQRAGEHPTLMPGSAARLSHGWAGFTKRLCRKTG